MVFIFRVTLLIGVTPWAIVHSRQPMPRNFLANYQSENFTLNWPIGAIFPYVASVDRNGGKKGPSGVKCVDKTARVIARLNMKID